MERAWLPAVSCVFAPSLDTPAHIQLAERLGYRRAWCYDSPALYADPWMVLALAAGRTAGISARDWYRVPTTTGKRFIPNSRPGVLMCRGRLPLLESDAVWFTAVLVINHSFARGP